MHFAKSHRDKLMQKAIEQLGRLAKSGTGSWCASPIAGSLGGQR